MTRYVVAALVAAGAVASAAPAAATVTICTGNNCAATNENVMITAASNVTTVNGTGNSSGVGVLFTSSTDRLNGGANGQADISAVDGLLNSLTFTLANGASFGSATFNLFPLPGNQNNEATQVILTYNGGSQTQTISTNGNNFLGISGNAGERFTSITFIGSPATSGIQDFRQLRLGGVITAVPEPTTWLLMLSGFSLVAMAARRRRRRAGASAYVIA